MNINWIFSLFSVALAVVPLISFAGKRRAQSVLAEKEVGALGWLYNITLKMPLRSLYILLIIVAIWSFITLGMSIFYHNLNNTDQASWMNSVLDYSLWQLPAALLFAFLAYTNLGSRLLLSLTKLFGINRFKPGWINAHWQLNPPADNYAANVNIGNCQRLAKTVLEKVIQETAPPKLQAPYLESTDTDEIANYLLIMGAIESHIGRIYYGDASTLKNMQKYLVWAAETERRPFKPSEIINHAKRKESFYNTLYSLGKGKQAQVGNLPYDPPIKESVDKIVVQLAGKYKGKGSNLAKPFSLGWCFKDVVNRVVARLAGKDKGKGSHLAKPFSLEWRPSAKAVLQRLGKFDTYNVGEEYRLVFLKQFIRTGIWPNMDPCPFPFPYNDGIAILLLNSGCITTPADLSFILRDDNFRDLVRFTEDQVIKACYKILKLNSTDSATINFCKAVFKCEPNNVPQWSFIDRVDTFLFDHTKQYCIPKSKGLQLAAPCQLISHNNICYCMSASQKWLRRGNSLIK